MPATYTDRLQGLTTSVAVKAPVKVDTVTNITLSGLQTIQGVALAAGDRVLVKAQTVAADNGIYNASETAWTRSLDFDGNRDVVQNSIVYVAQGPNEAKGFYVVPPNPITIGVTGITFEALPDESGGGGGGDDQITIDVQVTAILAEAFDPSNPPASADNYFYNIGDLFAAVAQPSNDRVNNGVWTYNGPGVAVTRPGSYANGQEVQSSEGPDNRSFKVQSQFGDSLAGQIWEITSPAAAIVGETGTVWAQYLGATSQPFAGQLFGGAQRAASGQTAAIFRRLATTDKPKVRTADVYQQVAWAPGFKSGRRKYFEEQWQDTNPLSGGNQLSLALREYRGDLYFAQSRLLFTSGLTLTGLRGVRLIAEPLRSKRITISTVRPNDHALTLDDCQDVTFVGNWNFRAIGGTNGTRGGLRLINGSKRIMGIDGTVRFEGFDFGLDVIGDTGGDITDCEFDRIEVFDCATKGVRLKGVSAGKVLRFNIKEFAADCTTAAGAQVHASVEDYSEDIEIGYRNGGLVQKGATGFQTTAADAASRPKRVRFGGIADGFARYGVELLYGEDIKDAVEARNGLNTADATLLRLGSGHYFGPLLTGEIDVTGLRAYGNSRHGVFNNAGSAANVHGAGVHCRTNSQATSNTYDGWHNNGGTATPAISGSRFGDDDGLFASSVLTFSSNPSAGQTITLNGTVVTADTDYVIAGSREATMANLAAFLQASTDAQIVKCLYQYTPGTNTLTLVYKIAGTAGNAFTTTETHTGGAFTGATLAGGAASAGPQRYGFKRDNSAGDANLTGNDYTGNLTGGLG